MPSHRNMAICFALQLNYKRNNHNRSPWFYEETSCLRTNILHRKLENDCHSIVALITKRKGSTPTAIVRSQNSIIYYVFSKVMCQNRTIKRIGLILNFRY